jgi:hypothetical protein
VRRVDGNEKKVGRLGEVNANTEGTIIERTGKRAFTQILRIDENRAHRTFA